MTMKVAIVGAGCAGITAIKSCIDEGLEPVCFEATGVLGGLWNIRGDASSVYESTVINTSKEMMSYTDFLIPSDWPKFLPHYLVLKYFNMYADKFNLRDHIKFKHRVTWITPMAPGDGSNGWSVTYTNAEGQILEQHFDAVMVCNGHHWSESMPSFPGQDTFQGKIFHSHEYKNWKGLEDKRTVVVGVGNSGVDVAVELSRVCPAVHLSTRSGTWVFNRIIKGGIPLDQQRSLFLDWYILKMADTGVHAYLQSQMEDSGKLSAYGLEPVHAIEAAHPTINGELRGRIVTGHVQPRPNIREIKENSVVFEDGVEKEVDTIVLCTGYKISIPFLDPKVLHVQNNEYKGCYKLVFPTQHKNIAMIGFFQPLGAIMPLSEMQCRWATRVFNGKTRLPPLSVMQKHEEKSMWEMHHQYEHKQRHTIQVDFARYMWDLGEEFGANPNMRRLFFTSPKLWFHVMFKPSYPQIWRLCGPGRWDGAADAIYQCASMLYQPCKTTRQVAPEQFTDKRRAVLRKQGRLFKLLKIVKMWVVLWLVYRIYRSYRPS